jgi:hypothetical protein
LQRVQSTSGAVPQADNNFVDLHDDREMPNGDAILAEGINIPPNLALEIFELSKRVLDVNDLQFSPGRRQREQGGALGVGASGECDLDDSPGGLIDPVSRKVRLPLRVLLQRNHLVFHCYAAIHLGPLFHR